MSLEISIASRAEQDMTLQYRWYLENADFDVPSATCWPCMKRSRASPGSQTSASAAISPRQNLPVSAASRFEGPLTAICSLTGMAHSAH
jgi:hypothetical protein